MSFANTEPAVACGPQKHPTTLDRLLWSHHDIPGLSTAHIAALLNDERRRKALHAWLAAEQIEEVGSLVRFKLSFIPSNSTFLMICATFIGLKAAPHVDQAQ